MSALCQFNISTSVRPDLMPVNCGDIARYSHNDEFLCEFHLNMALERIVVCAICDLPDSMSYRVFSALHRNSCSYLAQGFDCYCMENAGSCSCSCLWDRELSEA